MFIMTINCENVILYSDAILYGLLQLSYDDNVTIVDYRKLFCVVAQNDRNGIESMTLSDMKIQNVCERKV